MQIYILSAHSPHGSDTDDILRNSQVFKTLEEAKAAALEILADESDEPATIEWDELHYEFYGAGLGWLFLIRPQNLV